MESPINPKVPQMVMKASLGAFALASLFSVYHKRYRMLAATDGLFIQVLSAKDEEEKVKRMNAIASKLQEDAAAKKGEARLSSERHCRDLLRLVVLKQDGSNEASVSAATKLLCRVFAQSNSGRKELARHNGPKILLKSLSVAHSTGLLDVAEDIALALRELTTFDETKVVLQNDVPEGAECAYALAQIPSISSMLAILDPESPTTFLSATVALLANVCSLHAGAQTIERGCHGRSGTSFFLRLLDHSNLSVVGKAVEAIAFLCRAGCGRKEVAQAENIQRLASNFSVRSEKNTINKILTIIMIMAGDEVHSVPFFEHLPKTGMIRAMFEIWVSNAEMETRNRAEMVACVCLRVPSTAAHSLELLQLYRRAIIERNQKDEQEHQRKMQERQQQQYMQRMMMEQMGMI